MKKHITVAGRGKISEPITAGSSKLDWRCFEYYQIDRNEFHICPNFGGKKMSENLKNLENLEEEKVKIQPCAQPNDLPKAGHRFV